MGWRHNYGNWRNVWARLCGTDATQLVELAVTLPLLVVMVVGIFDFGGAYNLKQNLSGAARDGARFASSLPTTDLQNPGTPDSVTSVRNAIDGYLKAAKINDCGLAGRPASSVGTLAWQYNASTGCPGTLTLTIERSYDYQANIGASRLVDIISTRVTISYPHKWEFGKVIGLLAPGANYAAGVSQISTFAIVPNQD
jgi:Flp pilus assembly protein TadG